MTTNIFIMLTIFFAALVLLVITLLVLENRGKLRDLERLDKELDKKLQENQQEVEIIADDSAESSETDEANQAEGEQPSAGQQLKVEHQLKQLVQSPQQPQNPQQTELELPFEPIYSFPPDPQQWTDRYRELNRYPWPQPDEAAQAEYEDRAAPDPSSEKFVEAVDWLTEAGTEAIHRQEKFTKFFSSLVPFIEAPRAAGAEAVARVPWRGKSANISRLIGERLLVMAVALSSYGAVKMNSHKKALKNLLDGQWNADGLETPLVYQAIGRLGLLTATDMGSFQEILKTHLIACSPDPEGPRLKRQGQARYHALLLALSSGPEYPFPLDDQQRSRLWVFDEDRPPLAVWEHLLPVLYTLWNYHWSARQNYQATRDLTALLGEWWDSNPPPEDFFDENPGYWEALLICAWAWTPEHPGIWGSLEERFAQIDAENPWLQEVTDCYLGWVEYYRENSRRPEESFHGHRFPPLAWIKPLPSDLIETVSQPSFDFPDSWLAELGQVEWPDIYSLESSYQPSVEVNR